MTFVPRLAALDVDGTLVDQTNALSPAVRETVLALAETGVVIVVATGRAMPGTMEVVERLGLEDGTAVTSNGAIVVGYHPVEVLHSVTFDASEAVRRVLESVPDALVAVEEVGVGYRVNKPFPEGEVSGRITVEDVDSLVSEPVTRVVIRAPEHDAREFAAVVEGLGLTETNYYIGYTAWLDLAPQGVSKASGLEIVCARLDIDPADVLAVGDGFNDVEMLRWAGRGVAMGQAPDEVVAVADDVTDFRGRRRPGHGARALPLGQATWDVSRASKASSTSSIVGMFATTAGSGRSASASRCSRSRRRWRLMVDVEHPRRSASCWQVSFGKACREVSTASWLTGPPPTRGAPYGVSVDRTTSMPSCSRMSTRSASVVHAT